MDDNLKKEKIRRFLADTAMERAVREEILETYLSPVHGDNLHVIAASRIAIDLLDKAWDNLNKHRTDENKEATQKTQVGL